jgi:hypothetical protein
MRKSVLVLIALIAALSIALAFFHIASTSDAIRGGTVAICVLIVVASLPSEVVAWLGFGVAEHHNFDQPIGQDPLELLLSSYSVDKGAEVALRNTLLELVRAARLRHDSEAIAELEAQLTPQADDDPETRRLDAELVEQTLRRLEDSWQPH